MSENNQPNIDVSAVPISKETGDALIKPVATAIGNASGTVLDGLFHLILDPIRKFNIQRNFALEQFEKEVKSSVSEIPQEFLDESKTGIVLKAIEDSRYQLNEEYIRELFTKLITSALDSRNNSSITPKYSSIISDMSVSEAKLLEKIYHNTGLAVPVAEIEIDDKDNGIKISKNKILLFDDQEMHSFEVELALLESSNLIKFNQGYKLTNPHYVKIMDNFEFKFHTEYIDTTFSDTKVVQPIYSFYSLTALGESLCEIVFAQ